MTVQIVFVGHHKKRLLESIKALREYPVSKIILAVGEQRSRGEEIARRVAREIESEVKAVWDVEVAEVDKKDTIRAASQLVQLINSQEEDVILNVSGSLRTFSIAAYIAASVTGSRVISSIPQYDENDVEVGIEEIVEIPILPVNLPGKEQMEIINALDGERTLDELVFKLNPGMKKDSQEFKSERSRISHHIARLEDVGFVKRRKEGRNVKIKVTDLGEILWGV
ncbi:MAG: DUF6293 family protein [Candidatus Hadarchaeota archaeon]